MKENIDNSINKYLRSFYDEYYEKNNLLFDNLKIFWKLIHFIHSLIEDYSENNCEKIDWYKISKVSLLEEEKIIDPFYEKLNINFKLNDIIEDGTLEIHTRTIEELIESKKRHISVNGINQYQGEHKTIEIYNNGLITDSITLVHEISHYRNQSDEGRTQINNLFTEALAFAEELIYIDYLRGLGYGYEAYSFQYMTILTFYHIICDSYPLIKICLLYYELGAISKENYKLYYKDDSDYDIILSDFKEIMTANEAKYKNLGKELLEDKEQLSNFNKEMRNTLWYVLAAPLSIYMYEKYKNNNNYIDNIKKLNDTIMNNNINNKTVVECLNVIGISNYDEESLDKIKLSFESYIKELKENKNKTKERILK